MLRHARAPAVLILSSLLFACAPTRPALRARSGVNPSDLSAEQAVADIEATKANFFSLQDFMFDFQRGIFRRRINDAEKSWATSAVERESAALEGLNAKMDAVVAGSVAPRQVQSPPEQTVSLAVYFFDKGSDVWERARRRANYAAGVCGLYWALAIPGTKPEAIERERGFVAKAKAELTAPLAQ